MFFLPENGERGRNLLRGRETLPAQPETPYQHDQESGSSTAGDSTRDLTLESPRSKKRQSDDSTLESSRHKLLIVWSESSMTL